MLKTFEELREFAAGKSGVKVAIAGARDPEALKAAGRAYEEGLARFYLVDDAQKISQAAEEAGISLEGFEIVDVNDEVSAARKAVELARVGEVHAVMKGLVKTATFLKAVLDKEVGIRRAKLLSHVAMFEIPTYHKILFLTDGGMVPYPDLDTKVEILKNALWVTSRLGYDRPKVAVLAAVETVNPTMEPTVHAAALALMARRKQIQAIVDGPLALDNVLSKEAAKRKGIESEVAGDADILLVPDIDAGNMLGKSFTYAAGGKMAGIVVGATVPVIVPSRADDWISKYYSLVAGIALKEEG